SSCAAIARKPKLIEKVVPSDQVLVGEGYTGLVVCWFWRFGEWVMVCIDDRLPTKDDKLIFARGDNPQEFWVALVEKAYAKETGVWHTRLMKMDWWRVMPIRSLAWPVLYTRSWVS
ncbi:hypothetical protein OTU49_007460, partial [Cherax quadricarinatus]